MNNAKMSNSFSTKNAFSVLFLLTAVLCSFTSGQTVAVSVAPSSATVKTRAINAAEIIGTNTAQYTITGSFDPSSLETGEIKPVGPIWTCSCTNITFVPPAGVQPVPANPGNPTDCGSQTGTSSWVVKVASPNAGQWKLTFTVSVIYAVWDKKTNSYKRDKNNAIVAFGPFTGTCECAFNSTNGNFKIILSPRDKCKETATNKRSVTRFGLGEKGSIQLETIPPGLPIDTIDTASSDTNICTVGTMSFTIKHQPGTATITANARINNSPTAETATYTLTAIAPTGMYFDTASKENLPNPGDPNGSGAGFRANIYLLPKDVSFYYLPLCEEECNSVVTGNLPSGGHSPSPAFKNPEKGDVEMGCYLAKDNVASFLLSKAINGKFFGTATWSIRLLYKDKSAQSLPTGITSTQMAMYLPNGVVQVSKLNILVIRGPNNEPLYLQDPPNYAGGFSYR